MSDEATTPEGGTAGTAPASESSEKTFTQAELDSIIKDRLNRQRAQIQNDAAGEADLRSKLNSLTEEATTLKNDRTLHTARIAELEQDFTAASRDAAALKVALEKGIPAELVSRLRGNTVDELSEDADNLVKLVGAHRGSSGFDGGTRRGAPGAGQTTGPGGFDQILRRGAGVA